MGQAFSGAGSAGKDGKAIARAQPPSRLFGLDTLSALLAEQIDHGQTAPPRHGPATIEAWLVSEGLQDVAADVEDLPDLPASAASLAAAAARPETGAILQAWEEEAVDRPVFGPPARPANVAAAREAAAADPETGAILQAWEEEALDLPVFHPPATPASLAAAREAARRRELLGAVDRLTATARAGRTSRSA